MRLRPHTHAALLSRFHKLAKTKFRTTRKRQQAKQRSSITSVAWQLRFGKNRKTFPVKWSNHSQGVDTTTEGDEVQEGRKIFFTNFLHSAPGGDQRWRSGCLRRELTAIIPAYETLATGTPEPVVIWDKSFRGEGLNGGV